jgi:hypothetical protein
VKITERVVDIKGLALSDEQSATRSPGLHISSIVDYLATSIGRRDNNFTREQLDQYAIFGRIWEHHLANALFKPPRYQRIGEIEKDGIIGSPDSVDTEDWSVQEFKCTWKSSARPPESFHEYWWQVKSYCHMLSMNRATLYPVFICGDWKPPVPSARVAWDVVFSHQELLENWNMILRASREMPTP